MKLSKEEPLKAKEKAAPTLVASSEGPFGAGRVEVHTLQVCWHASNQEDSLKTVNLPILTCDMATGRLVTGGGDNCARLWRLERKECGDFHARFLATLSGHEKSVNAVRFSSCGKYVATGGDDGLLLVWILDEERSVIVAKDESDEAQEVWRVEARTHLPEDVYDISWAPRTAELIVGSTDHKCTLFSLRESGLTKLAELSQHRKYVQGVAYDPRFEFVVSASNDRHVRVYGLWNKKGARRKSPMCEFVLKKGIPIEENVKADAYFHDDTVPTFFRRIAWSPDGNLLVCPTGASKEINCSYVFSRKSFPHAILELPHGKYPSVCVRFSPILYELISNGEKSAEKLFDLPYRMVYAIGATDSVILIYDTQHADPIFRVSGIHYEPINDLCFAENGNQLLIASTDGYCSVVDFQENALGKPLSEEASKKALSVLDTHWIAAEALAAKREKEREKEKEKALLVAALEPVASPSAEISAVSVPAKPTAEIVSSFFNIDPSQIKKPEEFIEEKLEIDNDDSAMPMVFAKKSKIDDQ